MTAGHEQDIATYLTLDGKVFLAPQFNIAFDRDLNEGGACPDFVALDLERREIIVVEVTSAADWKPLARRVSERSTRWYGPIRRRMQELGLPAADWEGIRFLGFVREANVTPAKAEFTSDSDVTFYAIEDATFLWRYWDKRIQDGLPDANRPHIQIATGITPDLP